MNVYDIAHNLKNALSECSEVKEYKDALNKVNSNPANKTMLDNFRKKQFELQTMEFSGMEPDKEKAEQLEKLYSVLSLNSEINRLLQCEYKLGVLMNDISKIISEAIDTEE